MLSIPGRRVTPSTALTWPISGREQRGIAGPLPCRHQPFSKWVPEGQNRGASLVIGARRDDIDVAVFRFTLGIPGFDDALIPRVVGAVGALLIVGNHVLDAGSASAAQVRTEVLGALLCGLCVATPSIGQRLQKAMPGRGRLAGGSEPQGSRSLFKIDEGLTEDCKTELAWASYALLRNTNSSGLLVARDDRVLVVRGTVGSTDQASASLDSVSQALSAAAALEGPLAQVLTGAQQPSVYLPDPAAISGAGARQWGFLPGEAQSLLLQRLQELPSSGGDGGTADSDSMGLTKGRTVLLLWSDMPRALSQRERLWATAVAAKLSSILAAG